jgi:hypothetical protein
MMTLLEEECASGRPVRWTDAHGDDRLSGSGRGATG